MIYTAGLKENTDLRGWLTDYLEKNKESICFYGKHTIVVGDRSYDRYLAVDGNESYEISFVVQDDSNVLERFTVNEDRDNIVEAYNCALAYFVTMEK